MKIIFAFLMSVFCLSSSFAASESTGLPTKTTDASRYIDVGTPGVKKVRLAVPAFYVEKTIVFANNTVPTSTARFKEILGFTDWFYFIPESAFVYKKHPALSPFKAADWRVIEADFVVLGTLNKIKGSDRLEFVLSVVRVADSEVLVKQRYTIKNLDTDLALRDFGDMLVQAVTGTPGPFMSNIVFVGRTSQKARTSDIYIADFDGRNARKITKNNTINISPSWSPDGNKITYTSFQTGKSEIFEYNLITQKTRQMTFENSNSSGATWNSTGDLIAFSLGTKDGATHIYTITDAGAVKEPLITTSTIAVEPAFSPKGTHLAYTSNKYSRPMIFLYNFENNEATRLTFAGWYNASPAWDPDGERIVFASFDRDVDRWDIFKIDVDGDNLERFTLNQGDNEKPSWSPDGRFIVFQSNRGDATNLDTVRGSYRLHVMSEDGTNQKPLRMSVPDCRQPAWGPRFLPDPTVRTRAENIQPSRDDLL